MNKLLEQIISLDSYRPALLKLQQIDQAQTKLIETALTAATLETHNGMHEAENNGDRLRYWLYREAVEIKAHTSSYLSYSEMMATREANLWKFTLGSTDQFFETVFDELDTYFATKKNRMLADCNEKSTWYSGLADSSKKILTPVNLAKKKVGEAAEKLGVELPEGDIVDTKSIVERLLDKHVNPNDLKTDITRILGRAGDRFTENWKKQIQSQAPDLSSLKAFASNSATISAPAIAFQFGIPEQTLAMGIAGGVAGVVGLAAGWHTLTYALINVFPPVAIFSVIAAVSLAILTQNRTMENRQSQIAEVVNQYHRQLLLHIDSQRIQELNGQTMRDAINQQNRTIVKNTLEQWQKMISGNLTTEHYRLLVGATTTHLLLVEKALANV